MIVVVEGPSAAGKTTWCAAHAPGSVVPENGRIEPPTADPDELARFWSDLNCRRWAQALRTETEHEIAVCDTDPLKLHYDYCLARAGESSWERFEAGRVAATDAIASRRLGLADLVLINIPDGETLQRRRDADPTRRRRNFNLHRRLGPGLRDWYGTLAAVDPGRIVWHYPTELPRPTSRGRYDTDLFDTWMAELPRHSNST